MVIRSNITSNTIIRIPTTIRKSISFMSPVSNFGIITRKTRSIITVDTQHMDLTSMKEGERTSVFILCVMIIDVPGSASEP